MKMTKASKIQSNGRSSGRIRNNGFAKSQNEERGGAECRIDSYMIESRN